jgi:hypothetical protein
MPTDGTTTSRQNIRIPLATDDPNVVDDIGKLVADIEIRLAGTYANAADRTARNPAPVAGQIAILTATNTITMYGGTNTGWLQIYPPPAQPTITSGTNIPANSFGANGDLFLKV